MSSDRRRLRVAIVGSGNIGTDLMMQGRAEPGARAGRHGRDRPGVGRPPAGPGAADTSTTDAGARRRSSTGRRRSTWRSTRPRRTSHRRARPAARRARDPCVDLTPAALGPAVVPPSTWPSTLDAPEREPDHVRRPGDDPDRRRGQPASRGVPYAEIVSTVASRVRRAGHAAEHRRVHDSATARGLETIGGAGEGKAIIILNPAEPPIMMRNTVYARSRMPDRDAVAAAIRDAVAEVAGVRARLPAHDRPADRATTWRRSCVEVEGAGDYLPPYAGNLDIMTAAAVRVAELLRRERRDDGRPAGPARGLDAARRLARDRAPVHGRAGSDDRRGARRAGVLGDRGRPRRRPGGVVDQVRPAVPLRRRADLAAAAEIDERARIAVAILPGIGTKQDLEDAPRSRRDRGPDRDALHRGRHLASAHRAVARAGDGRARLPDDGPHDRRPEALRGRRPRSSSDAGGTGVLHRRLGRRDH